MPIAKGVMSYTRFRIATDVVSTPATIVEKINLFRFRPLDPRGEDSETLGYCPFLSEYDEDRPIDGKDIFYDDKVILALRIDSLKMPKDLLRSMVKKSLQAYQRDHKKLPDRTVKKEIELAEAKSLRMKILPSTKIIESVWCQKTNEIRVLSRAPTMLDRFIELFQQTFMVKLEQRDFPVEILRINQQKVQPTDLLLIAHDPLYTPPVRVDVQ